MDMYTDCLVCGSEAGDDGTSIISASTSPMKFCSECWELIFHAVYESLRESGQIVDNPDEQ